MAYCPNSSLKGSDKFIFLVISFFLAFLFGIIVGWSFIDTRFKVNFIFPSDTKLNRILSNNKQILTENFRNAYNGTHLWSMRLADDNYFRLARLLPCRNVTYSGGPEPDKIDSCDQSPTNEFSIKNTIEAQKWIYEHQHPVDCTNKRFAIIHAFAWSGFGSTVHQIAWALGNALGQDRIAVYEVPGNWVNNRYNLFST